MLLPHPPTSFAGGRQTKKKLFSTYSSWWFLSAGVLAAHYESFWLPFTPTTVEKELYHIDMVQEACS